MKKVIHHLRQRPEKERRQILYIFTIFCAVILALLWIYSLGAYGGSESASKINQDLKPLSAIKDNLVGGYKSIYQ